ncbi:hypothetical protein PTKIN_Ptkin17bG0008400 [Pterospermum kingtungense]
MQLLQIPMLEMMVPSMSFQQLCKATDNFRIDKYNRKVFKLAENNFNITDVNGTLIFKVKGKMLSIRDRRLLLDAPGSPLISQGGWHESGCTIYAGKTIIAQMHRKHSVKSMVLDADSYGVTAHPNVDYAFVAALVVVLDEINADRSGED